MKPVRGSTQRMVWLLRKLYIWAGEETISVSFRIIFGTTCNHKKGVFRTGRDRGT
jgi:hypothetical protein